jgi:dephospho-CoA kinase
MTTAIVLYGPKAVGKSWVAQVLRTHLGVAHADADELGSGVGPGGELGP